MDELKKYREQHNKSYKNAVIDNIKNNTYALFNEDIASLIKKPPLDSMDIIKNKFISLAKKNKIVLKTLDLDNLLNDYRDKCLSSFDKLMKLRIDKLSNIVSNKEEIIKINKKDFNSINKEIKKEFKTNLIKYYEDIILKNINDIFDKEVSEDIKNNITSEITKYINKNYLKQIIEGIEVKLLVKDTTLINNVKELTERYLFTLNNSRLLNDL